MTERKRKPVTAAHIELWLWFRSEAVFRQYAAYEFGANSNTITDREWMSGEFLDEDPQGPVEVLFRFVHTCRNLGSQEPDSMRFFKATRVRAGIAEEDAAVEVVELLGRKMIAL